MRHSDWAILVGLGLAVIAASAIALIAGLPLRATVATESGMLALFDIINSVTAFALPGAGFAIALSEARRVRGLPYFVAAGWAIALAGYWFLDDQANARAAVTLIAMGTAAAYVYWRVAGKFAGRLGAKIAAAGDGSLTDEQSMRRCRVCTAVTIGIAGLTAVFYARIFIHHVQATPAPDAKWLWWSVALAFVAGLFVGLAIWRICAKPHLQAGHARDLQHRARLSDIFDSTH